MPRHQFDEPRTFLFFVDRGLQNGPYQWAITPRGLRICHLGKGHEKIDPKETTLWPEPELCCRQKTTLQVMDDGECKSSEVRSQMATTELFMYTRCCKLSFLCRCTTTTMSSSSSSCSRTQIHLHNTQILAIFFSITSKQVCRTTVALPFTWTSILRKKKNYGNSNISPCKKKKKAKKYKQTDNKNPIFKKSSKKETKIVQDIIITLL